MRAFVVHELTHPSKVVLDRNCAEPTAGPQEILVDIFSAGLNFLDVRFNTLMLTSD
jgi:NADPH2:quinone reductase